MAGHVEIVIIICNLKSAQVQGVSELFFITKLKVFNLTAITHMAKTRQNHDRLHTSTSGTNEKIFSVIKHFLTNQQLLWNFQASQFLSHFKHIRRLIWLQSQKGWTLDICAEWVSMAKIYIALGFLARWINNKQWPTCTWLSGLVKLWLAECESQLTHDLPLPWSLLKKTLCQILVGGKYG